MIPFTKVDPIAETIELQDMRSGCPLLRAHELLTEVFGLAMVDPIA